jgi:hypothetical protein
MIYHPSLNMNMNMNTNPPGMSLNTQHSSPLDRSSCVLPLSTDFTACGREKGKPSTGSWFMMACSKATFREFLPVEEL